MNVVIVTIYSHLTPLSDEIRLASLDVLNVVIYDVI